MIVADAALIAYLVIPGEHTNDADRVRRADSHWISPPLWQSEMRNVLRNYIASDRLPIKLALEYMTQAEDLMAGRSHPVESRDVLTLAADSGCSAYDCEYVALARAVKVTLVTTDRQVLARFPDVSVHPRDFLSE